MNNSNTTTTTASYNRYISSEQIKQQAIAEILEAIEEWKEMKKDPLEIIAAYENEKAALEILKQKCQQCVQNIAFEIVDDKDEGINVVKKLILDISENSGKVSLSAVKLKMLSKKIEELDPTKYNTLLDELNPLKLCLKCLEILKLMNNRCRDGLIHDENADAAKDIIKTIDEQIRDLQDELRKFNGEGSGPVSVVIHERDQYGSFTRRNN